MRKFEITKEQILLLAEQHSWSESKLKEWFPRAFESELEVGKWYKNITHEYIFCFNGEREDFSQYGFSRDGEWKINLSAHERHSFILATEKEVETALISEAKRRGFKEGIKFKTIDGSERICTFLGGEIHIGFNVFTANIHKEEWEKEGEYISSNPSIFEDGQWAEIISEPIEVTLEEIAEKFNVNVEQLKIKK